jgi:PAS domain S-box-containing protein
LPWGTHSCQFYRTKQDLLDVLVPYFRSGLHHNEFCLWVTSDPLTAAEAATAMRRAVPGFDDTARRGQIEISPHTDWYLRDGRFDGDRVLADWLAKLETAQASGYDGMRVTGNTFWLEQQSWRAFADYEDACNRGIGDSPIIALCTYSLERCSALDVMDVLTTHQFALVKQHGTWKLIESADRRAAAEALNRANEALVHDLRGAQRYSRSLIEASLDPLVTISPVGTITDVNAATEQVTGRSRAELVGTEFSAYFTDPDLARAGYEQVFRDGTVHDYPLDLRHRDGHTTPVLYNASVYHDDAGQVLGVFAAARDISERKQAEASARWLTQLEDRNRIARDLHDTVIQDLLAIGIQLHRGSRHPDACRADDEREDLVAQLDAAVQRLRACIFALRHDDSPATTLTDDLQATVRKAGRILCHQPDLAVHGPANQLPPATAREINAVVTEALANVARHAQATATTLTLHVTPDQVHLTIEDNGQGLPAHPTPGDGLANLAARAHARDGQMTLTSPDTGGTRLQWSCPGHLPT